MLIQRRKTDFRRLSEQEIAEWSTLPSSVVSDVMNRFQAVGGKIKPVKQGTRCVGQARTVLAMVADSSTVHVACSLLEPGDVLVMNVGGYIDRACWGGIATRTAMRRGARGMVTDGATRDVEEIRELGFPVYCAAAVPSGPHKGHGGIIDDTIAFNDATVSPGDIVVGDDDGLSFIPLGRAAEVLSAARAQLAKEASWIEMIENGGSMAEVLGLTYETIS
jgi:4-hydroxy-4-methyl-2-oxoglutarate aldolase